MILKKLSNCIYTLNIILIISLITTSTICAKEISISTPNSTIQFSVSHIGKTIVNGNFNSFNGHVIVTNNQLTKIEGLINVDSIETNNKIRNKYLKSKLFLNEKKYPHIYYVSESFIPSNNILLSYGKLTIHGVTNDIILPLNINASQNMIQTSTKLNRFNYELNQHKKMIGATVNIMMDISLEKPLNKN